MVVLTEELSRILKKTRGATRRRPGGPIKVNNRQMEIGNDFTLPPLRFNELFDAASEHTPLSPDSAQLLLQDCHDGFDTDLFLQPSCSINQSLHIIEIMPGVVPLDDFRLARRLCIF